MLVQLPLAGLCDMETDEQRGARIRATKPMERTDADLAWIHAREAAKRKAIADAESKARADNRTTNAALSLAERRSNKILDAELYRDGRWVTRRDRVALMLGRGDLPATTRKGEHLIGSLYVTKTEYDYAVKLLTKGE